jgi:hypothetical protein
MSDEPLGLVRYDAMRCAIAEASAIDEVKEIRDRAIALETYALQAQSVFEPLAYFARPKEAPVARTRWRSV